VADIRIRVKPLLLIGFAVAVAIVAIAVATALGGRGGTARTESAQSRGVGAAAPAYGHPPGCSSTASKPRHSRITLAEFDHTVWCERYHASPNSSLDQFIGAP
jgi:hypothetical protein